MRVRNANGGCRGGGLDLGMYFVFWAWHWRFSGAFVCYQFAFIVGRKESKLFVDFTFEMCVDMYDQSCAGGGGEECVFKKEVEGR